MLDVFVRSLRRTLIFTCENQFNGDREYYSGFSRFKLRDFEYTVIWFFFDLDCQPSDLLLYLFCF